MPAIVSGLYFPHFLRELLFSFQPILVRITQGAASGHIQCVSPFSDLFMGRCQHSGFAIKLRFLFNCAFVGDGRRFV